MVDEYPGMDLVLKQTTEVPKVPSLMTEEVKLPQYGRWYPGYSAVIMLSNTQPIR